MIDPYFGLLSRILYKRLFSSEAYDCNAPDWHYCAGHDKKSARPNQALSYLVFFRDRARFNTLFPRLEIVHLRILPNYIRYLLSGGLNFRQVHPPFLSRFSANWRWACYASLRFCAAPCRGNPKAKIVSPKNWFSNLGSNGRLSATPDWSAGQLSARVNSVADLVGFVF